MIEVEDIESVQEDPPICKLLDERPTNRIWGIAVAPLLLRDDGGMSLRQSLRKHRLIMMGLLFFILVVVIALVTSTLANKGGKVTENSAIATVSNDGKITKWDLETICSEGAKTFSTENVTEEVARRQSEFASMVADDGVVADLSPSSCSPENLAVLYLAANPPKNLNQKLLMTRFTLTTFFISLAGWKWKQGDNWLGNDSECTWYGVTCNDQGILTGITLRHNNLAGALPESLGYVSTLQVLNLAQNSITGTLPSSIATLSNLLTLEFSINKFSGSVPEGLWALSKMQIINLAHFGGTLARIPARIGKFTNLQRLVAPDTNVKGTIPTELGNCKSLRFLDLSKNKLVSPIPTELGSLGLLQTLYLTGNPFQLFNIDEMPEEICALLDDKLLAFDMKAFCPTVL